MLKTFYVHSVHNPGPCMATAVQVALAYFTSKYETLQDTLQVSMILYLRPSPLFLHAGPVPSAHAGHQPGGQLHAAAGGALGRFQGRGPGGLQVSEGACYCGVCPLMFSISRQFSPQSWGVGKLGAEW